MSWSIFIVEDDVVAAIQERAESRGVSRFGALSRLLTRWAAERWIPFAQGLIKNALRLTRKWHKFANLTSYSHRVRDEG
jgi:hypothetical protein